MSAKKKTELVYVPRDKKVGLTTQEVDGIMRDLMRFGMLGNDKRIRVSVGWAGQIQKMTIYSEEDET